MKDFDIAIIGAGIAGASLAAQLAPQKRVLLLEAETQPGYHATGRSAAFWSETYGGPAIQPLTSASGSFLLRPPKDFSEKSFLQQCGCLHLGQATDRETANAMRADFSRSTVALEEIGPDRIATYVAGLRDGWDVALWEPDCCDIDVAALHAAYLKQCKRQGVAVQCSAALTSARFASGQWALSTTGGQFSVSTLVNAAGAWADPVAQLSGVRPIGIRPFRRTMVQLAIEPAAPANLPLVVGLDGSFYFKSEAAGRLWLSPHDEIPTLACDAAPEELDIACAIDRFQQVLDWKITKLERKWAGLRSFALDRLPVIGRDPDCPEFFWLAGQGGFGIQTAPAVAALAAAILLDAANPVAAADPTCYAPDRLR